MRFTSDREKEITGWIKSFLKDAPPEGKTIAAIKKYLVYRDRRLRGREEVIKELLHELREKGILIRGNTAFKYLLPAGQSSSASSSPQSSARSSSPSGSQSSNQSSARSTAGPSSRVCRDKTKIAGKKSPIEEKLKEAIVGQEEAIATVATAIRRKQLRRYAEERPIVFLFVGPSGIGKTEMAKQVAEYLHIKKDKQNFFQFDMSEYQEKHEVARLIGAPPGYAGHSSGGQLTGKLMACPDAVVLLDEVDKAHPDVLTVLLQVFDEGRLTDGLGQTIHCKKAIFVMTSNLASEEIQSHVGELREKALREKRRRNKKDEEIKIKINNSFKDKVVYPILKQHFKRDEFLERINDIVYFLPFSDSELLVLVEKELKKLTKMAQENHNIILSYDTSLTELIREGYNLHYGARSIQNEVVSKVINLLVAAQDDGTVNDDSEVHITTEDHEVILRSHESR